jgi:hypothetical protein
MCGAARNRELFANNQTLAPIRSSTLIDPQSNGSGYQAAT